MSQLRLHGVSIAAVSHILPPRVVTSEEIEERLAPLYQRLKLPFGRLEMMTGIRERRFWPPGTPPSHGSVLAGQAALARAGFSTAEVGCVIHASVSRDFQEPATASVVHHALELHPDAGFFDLSNACLGVLNAMVVVANMISTGQISAGLVVACETAEDFHEATIDRALGDPKMDRATFNRQFASLTIGSGAAAVLLVDSRLRPDAPKLLGGAIRNDSGAHQFCQEDVSGTHSTTGPTMTTDSEALLNAGLALASDAWNATLQVLGWSSDAPDRFFTHQVGRVYEARLHELLGLDPAKGFSTLEALGNTGSVALPMALSLGIESGRLSPGDRVALLGAGSGVSLVMLGIEW